MSTHIRQFGINAMLALFILCVPVTLPLLFSGARELVATTSPIWLDKWKLTAGILWCGVTTLGLCIVAWDHRSTWVPVAGRTLLWLVRQPSRLLAGKGKQGIETPRVQGSNSGSRQNGFRPPLDLLGPPAKIETRPCLEVAQRVKDALTALGITGCEVVKHAAGPVVKIVQIRLTEQLRASAVIKAATDLSAMLGTQSVMVRPVEGAPGVLELSLSNTEKIEVPLRALMESSSLRQGHRLPVVVGVDATGSVLVLDLAASSTPHLLVAGTTGSGKSWFLRQLLVSLLYQFDPSELGLLLIDPKKVEFGLFEDLPHLLHPVVIDCAAARLVLEQLVQEMEQRYALFHTARVTNIHDYNQKHPKQRLACIVTVVDELGDLMLSREGKAVEEALQRLGQLARASGIHLVLATQRPSVDVVTGRIKAVIPARVSLALASHADSRTILDAGGAEKLRGNGDLFFMPGGSNLIRGQAAAIPDELVKKVVQWWAAQASTHAPPAVPALSVPEHAAVQFTQPTVPTQGSAGLPSLPPPALSKEDQELQWVKERVLITGVISRRIVQQGLGIGTYRANDLVKALDALGWLHPAKGPYPRRITLSVAERTVKLAMIRGVSREDVPLTETVEDVLESHGEPMGEGARRVEPAQTVGDKPQAVQQVDREVAEALVCRPMDLTQLSDLCRRLSALIDVALDQEDRVSFHILTANRRSVQAALDNR